MASLPAYLEADVLRWARESFGLSIEEDLLPPSSLRSRQKRSRKRPNSVDCPEHLSRNGAPVFVTIAGTELNRANVGQPHSEADGQGCRSAIGDGFHRFRHTCYRPVHLLDDGIGSADFFDVALF